MNQETTEKLVVVPDLMIKDDSERCHTMGRIDMLQLRVLEFGSGMCPKGSCLEDLIQVLVFRVRLWGTDRILRTLHSSIHWEVHNSIVD